VDDRKLTFPELATRPDGRSPSSARTVPAGRPEKGDKYIFLIASRNVFIAPSLAAGRAAGQKKCTYPLLGRHPGRAAGGSEQQGDNRGQTHHTSGAETAAATASTAMVVAALVGASKIEQLRALRPSSPTLRNTTA